MDKFEQYFEEYIEKIILKSRMMVPYEIYVNIPYKDLINEKLMKEIFEEFKEFYQALSLIKSSCDDAEIFRLSIRVLRYSNIKFKIGYYLLTEYISTSGTRAVGKNFDEEAYINLIKKIGSYYEWKDNEEILSENMEKKQTSLFSLLFNIL